MNSHPDRAFREDGGGSDPEQLLDQVLAHHRTQLMSTVAAALETDTGSNALVPLRHDLFHGLKPFRLVTPSDRTAADNITESAAPSARLQEILTRLRDIRLMVERIRDTADLPSDVHARSQTVATVLHRLHTGLQARTLPPHQVHSLIRELEAHAAHIGTAMLGRRTPLSRHAVEEWLRMTGSLRKVERMVVRLFRDAGDNVSTQG